MEHRGLRGDLALIKRIPCCVLQTTQKNKRTKTTRARYTLEFKQEAVRLVEGGRRQATVAKTLGLVEQTLFNRVKAKPLRQAHGHGQQACQRRADRDRAAARRVGAGED